MGASSMGTHQGQQPSIRPVIGAMTSTGIEENKTCVTEQRLHL
jgi:hypothetical protein